MVAAWSAGAVRGGGGDLFVDRFDVVVVGVGHECAVRAILGPVAGLVPRPAACRCRCQEECVNRIAVRRRECHVQATCLLVYGSLQGYRRGVIRWPPEFRNVLGLVTCGHAKRPERSSVEGPARLEVGGEDADVMNHDTPLSRSLAGSSLGLPAGLGLPLRWWVAFP